jgi:hypothetical protein
MKKYCIAVAMCDGRILKDLSRTADTREELEAMMTPNERAFGHTYSCESDDPHFGVLNRGN